ncbi:MAG: LON peptidase substrate-binding domain-containing protein [Terriglobales bacterium]
MPVPNALLPLFPLDVVLLPGAPLPLHVFEPRYKEMIGECLERKQPFGVLRAKDGEVAEVGCTAEILNVVKTYGDGRMDIMTQGRQRFEVMQVHSERPFLQAEVFYLRDDPGRATREEISRALELHGEIMKLAGSEPENVSEVNERELSFHLAGPLPLDLDFKQSLLGMKSESDRLRAVITFFENILPNVRRTMHVRRKAGGNGHAG